MEMKNLAWAVSGLVIVIIAIFLVSSKNRARQDTIIPTPQPVESPGPSFITRESSPPVMNLPFPILKKEELQGRKVKIETAKGDIVVELFDDAPITASNFIYLVNKKFYDGLTFHRREENFVIQGGDPKGDGTGGPGYAFTDEPVTRDYRRGVVAMANAGPNTNGSQLLADAPQLPKNYTIFGNAEESMEIVDIIQIGDKMEKVIVE